MSAYCAPSIVLSIKCIVSSNLHNNPWWETLLLPPLYKKKERIEREREREREKEKKREREKGTKEEIDYVT